MNVNQIKYFSSAVELGSFSAAASDLDITAQGVSKAVAELESEFGSPLFTRNNRGVVPTAFGMSLYSQAQEVLQSFHTLEAFAISHQASQASQASPLLGNTPLHLAICSPPMPHEKKTCKSLEKFFKEAFKVNATISISTDTTCMPALKNGSLDALLAIGGVDLPDMEYIPFGTIPLDVLVPKHNPLSKKASLTLEEIKGRTLNLPPSFRFFNDTVRYKCAKRGIAQELTALTFSFKAVESFFFRKNSLMIIPGIPALDLTFPGTAAIPLASRDSFAIPIGLVYLKGRKHPSIDAISTIRHLRINDMFNG